MAADRCQDFDSIKLLATAAANATPTPRPQAGDPHAGNCAPPPSSARPALMGLRILFCGFFALFFETLLRDFLLWPIDYSTRPLSFFEGASFSVFLAAFEVVVCRRLRETLGLAAALRDLAL